MKTSIPRLPLSKRNILLAKCLCTAQGTAARRNNGLKSCRSRKAQQKSLIVPRKKKCDKESLFRKNSKSEVRDKNTEQKILCLEDPSLLAKSNSYIQNNSVNEKRYSLSLLENDSSKIDSSKSFEGIQLPCNINRIAQNYCINADTESCSYDYSKDISINDCFRFNDPNLSSIERPYGCKNTEESSNKWRTSVGNKENTNENIQYFTSKGIENINSYDSNNSIEISGTPDHQIVSPFNIITNIANSTYKLNNTGKFAFGPFNGNKHNSIESSDECADGQTELQYQAKIALSNIDKMIIDINQFYFTRWEILKQNLLETCDGFQTDDVIKIMMEDEETKKYVTQRMQEILQDQWSSERESAIYQLTKQLGILELKHNSLIAQLNSKVDFQVNRQKLSLMNAKCEALEQQVIQLTHEVDLKNQEIQMMQTFSNSTSNGSSLQKQIDQMNQEYKQKIESILSENMSLKGHINYLTNEVNNKDQSLQKFEERESDLRNSIKDLQSRVNVITENQSKSIPDNFWSVESAIHMFNSRLQNLEKEKANHSEDEKEALKTPLNVSTDEQKVYIGKLKKTLRVYKGRSKDLEKRCIELECINCAMQKDIQEMHAKLEQTNVLYEQNNLIKEENAKMVNGICTFEDCIK